MARTTVRIPTPLRSFVGGKNELAVDAPTVGAAIQRIAEEHPELRRHLLTTEGQLRNFVSVYLNEKDVRTLQRDATPVRDGDVVSIVPAIAGGAPAEARDRTSSPGLARSEPAERPFTQDELRRYSRHLLLPEVGVSGQRALRRAKVLLVGTGGLGAPAALYLAAAGVGTLGLVDFDAVELSNLQRQVLYGTDDVGHRKLDAARARLERLNPGTTIVPHDGRLDASNALEVLKGYDVVIDGTDNFPTRYLVNDACVLLGKPTVYGSIYRFEGQVSVFDARRGPCYRCLYPEPPPPDLVPSCAEAGVLGVLPGVVGTLQATEAIKLIVGIGEPLVGRLLLYDASAMAFRELKLEKNPECVLCSPHATQHGLIDYPAFCGVDSEATAHTGVPEVTPEELRVELSGPEPPLLVDVREPEELEISHLDGALAIPKGELPERIDELTRARSVVLFCRSGSRSSDATKTLMELGFQNVRSLRGGINAWAQKIDPSLPTY
jgi:sulfur-carrier protein adenylyltransferase/sulfurtransferase